MITILQTKNGRSRPDRRLYGPIGGLLALALVGLGACQTNKNLQPAQATAAGVGGFDEADANHDGKLTRNEASDFLVNEIFTSRDKDHDGRMTKEEWMAGNDASQRKTFQARDKDHDGVITKEEAIAYGRAEGAAKKMLREADKNGDRALDRAEVQAYYASREGPPR